MIIYFNICANKTLTKKIETIFFCQCFNLLISIFFYNLATFFLSIKIDLHMYYMQFIRKERSESIGLTNEAKRVLIEEGNAHTHIIHYTHIIHTAYGIPFLATLRD